MGQINKVRLQFDLNIKMQKIISQIPELNPFLTRIPRNQHFQAVKHLIRLGLQTTQNYTCTQNGSDQSIMRRQLDIIKENIEELNNMVRQQPYNYCRCCQRNKEKIFQTQPENINKNQSKKGFGELVTFEKKNEQKPVRDGYQVVTLNYSNSQSTNPFAKNKSLIVRRNLDDTGAKQALTFPVQMLAQKPPKIKRKSQSFRKHIYQEQVNKQELEKIKEERGQSLDKLRRDRTVSDYSKATSKIKSLIEKDRIRYTQTKRKHQFQQGYNKYEYSDENQMEESSMHEEEAKAYQARLQRPHSQTNTYEKDLQSGFKPSSSKNSKKASSKKQLELSQREISSKLEGSLRGLKQQNQSGSSKQRYQNERSNQLYRSGEQNKEQQDDVISNSSSFSQFSMDGSRRKQVGKISRRSQND